MTRAHIQTPLLIALLVLASAGCDSERLDDGSTSLDERRSVIIDWDGPAPHPGDPFKISSAVFDDRVLKLEVSYSGGCEEHTFTLYTSNHIALSMPPQLTGWVVHDGHNDLCEAYITETIELDMSELINVLTGPFVLHVWSTPNRDSLSANYPG
ncbi:MAG: hypothetical protein O3B41_08430 [Bacteroidetes bacterium]|nr:hypothetical protein [Bacteroidota bacterium]